MTSALLIVALFATHITPNANDAALKQSHLAANGKIVVLTYGAGNGVYFARSDDAGKTFSAPLKVAESRNLALGMHRGPRIAIAGKAIVISAVIGEKGKGADGDLVAWRSTDGGNTWSSGARLNDVPAAAREGLHSMAADGKGTIFAVWLDLRGTGTQLYGAVSHDSGATWSTNVSVYESPSGSICQCCHPTAVVDAQGGIAVMFRNSLDGSRDLFAVTSTDGDKAFGPSMKFGKGTWQIDACPMDGGGLIAAHDGKLISAWRRQKEVFLAPLGGEEELLGTGKDPALAEGSQGVYVIWTSPAGLQARIPGRSEPVLLDRDGTYGQLVALQDGSILASWESKGTLVIQPVR